MAVAVFLLQKKESTVLKEEGINFIKSCCRDMGHCTEPITRECPVRNPIPVFCASANGKPWVQSRPPLSAHTQKSFP
ncbi:hypothetical protein CDAR_561541 [Caerostris darwini]|uniref:Uncharacterized protein n=1 Tax=Caerostris darwini TaxID=1538125 RepID=A0AAV4MJN9_9ARAC|nr:hypothetical protein CDAR_561541 [Caerostris darwini]